MHFARCVGVIIFKYGHGCLVAMSFCYSMLVYSTTPYYFALCMHLVHYGPLYGRPSLCFYGEIMYWAPKI